MLKNKAYFFGRKFNIIRGVYIPKHDSEYLVDIAHSLCIKNIAINTIIEVGTGTGCISITLAIMLSNINFFGIDIQEIAYKNTINNSVFYGRFIYLLLGDIFNIRMILPSIYKFDLLICNPPYLEEEEFKNKFYNSNLSDYIIERDKINCLGGIAWINNLLDLCIAKFIILEVSKYQIELISNKYYTILDTYLPFTNSKIIFVTLIMNNFIL